MLIHNRVFTGQIFNKQTYRHSSNTDMSGFWHDLSKLVTSKVVAKGL